MDIWQNDNITVVLYTLIAQPDEIFPIPDTKKYSIVLCYLYLTSPGDSQPIPLKAPTTLQTVKSEMASFEN